MDQEKSEDMILCVIVGIIHIVIVVFVYPFAMDWEVYGERFWGHSSYGGFFFCWFHLFFFSLILFPIICYPEDYSGFLELEAIVIFPFIISLLSYSLWPKETTIVIYVIFGFIALVVFGFFYTSLCAPVGGGGGGSECGYESERENLKEKKEVNPFGIFPYSHTVSDDKQEWKGVGFSKREAKKNVIEKMQKSGEFGEKNTSNPLETSFFSSFENPHSHEVINRKTGEKQIGHGSSQKEARENSWDKTSRS